MGYRRQLTSLWASSIGLRPCVYMTRIRTEPRRRVEQTAAGAGDRHRQGVAAERRVEVGPCLLACCVVWAKIAASRKLRRAGGDEAASSTSSKGDERLRERIDALEKELAEQRYVSHTTSFPLLTFVHSRAMVDALKATERELKRRVLELETDQGAIERDAR
jgi:hypothetical protein